LIYDRMLEINAGEISAQDEAPYRRGIGDLIAMKASEADLLPLLKHHDPKVRTLVMARLMMNDDANALPEIAALAHDPAPTFPNPQPREVPAVPGMPQIQSGIGPPPKDQTVGAVATAIVGFYLEAAGNGDGIDGFPAYWKTHKNRDHCASWFLVQLARASHGTSPVPAASADAIRQVRARVDRLPQPDRDWTLLLLGHSWMEDPEAIDRGGDAFVTQDEMIKVGQRLGPGKLVSALKSDIPCADPDMQSKGMGLPGAQNSYTAMQIFILHHATPLLRPQDADALLAQRQTERAREYGLVSAWWAIAAAHLQPARAASILHEDLRFFGSAKRAWDDGYDQADLGITLWQMEGESEAGFLANGSMTTCRKRMGT
jgi:hypothetical protein